MSDDTGAARLADMAGAAMHPRGVHDVAALAKQVRGFDADRYFDAQAQIEYAGALERWPVLARLMGLTPASTPAPAHQPQPAVAADHG